MVKVRFMVLEIEPGMELETAIQVAKSWAQRHDCYVLFDFNGAPVITGRKDSVEDMKFAYESRQHALALKRLVDAAGM